MPFNSAEKKRTTARKKKAHNPGAGNLNPLLLLFEGKTGGSLLISRGEGRKGNKGRATILRPSRKKIPYTLRCGKKGKNLLLFS